MLNRLSVAAHALAERSKLRPWTIPFFILLVGFLGLGLLTWNLGFFQDDWHHVYYFDRAGWDGLQRFLFLDGRPLASPVFAAFFSILGTRPLGWHVLLFLLRSLSALFFWRILIMLWPGHVRENTAIAALFLLYPVYLLQPLSVAYSLHWAMYLVYMLSALLMLLAVRETGKRLIFTLASLALQVFHLLMIEYFIGIELLRPLFLWLMFPGHARSGRFRKTLLHWLPYLAIDILYIIYRASFSRIFGYERFGDMTFLALLGRPLALIAFYVRAAFQDLVEILLSGWYAALQPSLFEFSSPARILVWLIVAVVLLASMAYFSLLKTGDQPAAGDIHWGLQVSGIGLAAVFLGILPGWIIGKTVYGSNPLWNDRFALAAMFGAAMLWVGLLCVFVQQSRRRYFLFGLLIALAIGINLHTQLDFKHSWEKQRAFYWQLLWRAPYIEPGTLLISDGEFLPYMGTNPTTFAVNTIYPQSLPFPQLSYWMANGSEHLPDWDEFRSGTPLQFSKYASSFSGDTTQSITISFLPEQGQCLWVLPPEYAKFPFLSAGLQETAPVSATGRIHAQPLQGWTPPARIIGPAPSLNWCYYFEKADLAAQYEDWDVIIRLWDEAGQKDLRPHHGAEIFPFIRAYAMRSDWPDAVRLTVASSRISERMTSAVCTLWDQIVSKTSDSPARQDAIQQLNERFSCGL